MREGVSDKQGVNDEQINGWKTHLDGNNRTSGGQRSSSWRYIIGFRWFQSVSIGCVGY